MNSYLTENQFFAPISVFSDLVKYDSLLIESQENYQKRGFRNRCIIDSAQGPLTLSIPLAKGKNEKMPIREVKISFDTNWQRLHLESIKSSYGNSPYFDHVYPDMIKIYQSADTFLYDLNMNALQWIVSFIEIDMVISETQTYEKRYDAASHKDVRNQLKSNNYTTSNIDYQRYAQVFEENHSFLPNLSILDLIFCTGKASQTYLS